MTVNCAHYRIYHVTGLSYYIQGCRESSTLIKILFFVQILFSIVSHCELIIGSGLVE